MVNRRAVGSGSGLNSEVGSDRGVRDIDLLVQVRFIGDIFTDHGLLHSFEFG